METLDANLVLRVDDSKSAIGALNRTEDFPRIPANSFKEASVFSCIFPKLVNPTI